MKKRLIVLFMICILAITCVACGSDAGSSSDPMVGSWKSKMGFVYTFKEGGKGTYDCMGTKYDIDWSTEDGKLSLKVWMPGVDENTKPSVLDYSIDGKTLTINDSFGNPVEYTRN